MVEMNFENLHRMYWTEEMSMDSIASLVGVSRKKIRSIFKKLNIPIKPREISNLHGASNRSNININSQDVISMFESGYTMVDIAKMLGTTRNVISNRLKFFGYQGLKNNANQRAKQSEMMKTKNPVPKGTKRPEYIAENIIEARKIAFEKRIRECSYDNYDSYAKIARYIAYKLYNKKVPKGFAIDHRYSIKNGFENKVPLYIISHPFNLELLTIEENSSKSSNNSITLDELYNGVGVQRPSFME